MSSISDYLRECADLYFAKAVDCVEPEKNRFEVRGFAFAKAADSVVQMERARVAVTVKKVPGIGPSISDVLEDVKKTGKSRKIEVLRRDFGLTPELKKLAALDGMTEPFVYVLCKTYSIVSVETALEKLPRVAQDNARVAERLAHALQRAK